MYVPLSSSPVRIMEHEPQLDVSHTKADGEGGAFDRAQVTARGRVDHGVPSARRSIWSVRRTIRCVRQCLALCFTLLMTVTG
jgi:hypothetical protein